MKASTWTKDSKGKDSQEDIIDSDDNDGPVTRTLKDYGSATTIHGIPYFLAEDRNPIERILWLLIVGIGIWIASSLSLDIYYGWKANPVATTVSTTVYDISNIEYPSITICSQGSVKELTGRDLKFNLFYRLPEGKAG